jgi:hypothetical protein
MLINLLFSATILSPSGSVSISAEAVEVSDANSPRQRISVIDFKQPEYFFAINGSPVQSP